MDIEFEHVTVGYRIGHPILQDINFHIEGPGLICIIGPNGVGKSTLVKCINKLLSPTEGTVKVNGRDVSKLSNKDIALDISYVPATGTDCFSMPVIDTILVGRHNHQKWKTTPKDLEMVYKAMDMMELTDLAMSGYNELSAGQHQRVALARGIVQDTDIMILDEPTANLDIKHQMYVTQLLRSFADNDNKLVLMICHDLNIAARYASKIIVMEPPGRIHKIGEVEEAITVDTIRQVYGIDCEVITYENRPMIIPKSEFPE